MIEVTIHHDIHVNNDDLKLLADVLANVAQQQQQINQLGEHVASLVQQLATHTTALQGAIDKEK